MDAADAMEDLQVTENPAAPSKKALKKLLKDQEKAAAKLLAAAANAATRKSQDEEDISIDMYGILPMNQSKTRLYQQRTKIDYFEHSKVPDDFIVHLRARVHSTRAKGKQCFMVLRQQSATIQAIISVSDTISKQMVKFCGRFVVSGRKSNIDDVV